MKDRYATVFFLVAGFVFAATGFTFVVAPGLVPAILDRPGATADAINDARAVYGAIELALGLFLASCAREPRDYAAGYRAAILVGGLAAISRFVGFVFVEGTPVAHVAYGALDFVGAFAAFHGMRRAGRNQLP